MCFTESIAFSLIGILIGYIIGNRLAIGRDRRKEFNDLINPIRADLMSIKIRPENNLRGTWIITLALIREKLPFWKRRGFDIAIETYEKSKGDENKNSDPAGGFNYKDTSLISHAADNLLKYLKPK
ncbi:MAG: hypothetical protein WC373_12250 [Smithella sp.]|jgi:hypothetical protein